MQPGAREQLAREPPSGRQGGEPEITESVHLWSNEDRNLRASLAWVLRQGRAHDMLIQRYDIPGPGRAGTQTSGMPGSSHDHGTLITAGWRGQRRAGSVG